MVGRRLSALALLGLVVGCASAPATGEGATRPLTAQASAEAGSLAAALPSAVAVKSPSGSTDAVLSDLKGSMCSEAAGAGGQAPLPVAVATPGPDEPRLWVSDLEEAVDGAVDVGALPAGRPSELRLTLQNVGTAPLVIAALSASCGCTRVETDVRMLGPGEATTLHVTYDPKAAGDSLGRIEEKIRVKSNDTRRPMAELAITGELVVAGPAVASPTPTE